jgi:hypothetical protein
MCVYKRSRAARSSIRMGWDHMVSVAWGTGTPKDRDEVNKRDVCECDG